MVRGTLRRNYKNELNAYDSKFLGINKLDSMREEIWYGF